MICRLVWHNGSVCGLGQESTRDDHTGLHGVGVDDKGARERLLSVGRKHPIGRCTLRDRSLRAEYQNAVVEQGTAECPSQQRVPGWQTVFQKFNRRPVRYWAGRTIFWAFGSSIYVSWEHPWNKEVRKSMRTTKLPLVSFQSCVCFRLRVSKPFSKKPCAARRAHGQNSRPGQALSYLSSVEVRSPGFMTCAGKLLDSGDSALLKRGIQVIEPKMRQKS
jgi:hypothetical protein